METERGRVSEISVRARSTFARFHLAAGFAAGFAIVFAIGAETLLLIGLLGNLAPELMAEESAGREFQLTVATRQEVWRAVLTEMRKEGLPEKQLPALEGLELPAALPALAGRRLRVASVCWDKAPQRTQFRLECGAPGECLPFLVYLRDSLRDRLSLGNPLRDPVGDAASSNSGGHAESCRLASLHAAADSPKPVVRAGDRATAVFHAERLRMTASVTCLEHGGAGEVIRVRGLDGHVFQARITGPGELEALPQ
jgi:Chaperone for flagella basal body P-ring formation